MTCYFCRTFAPFVVWGFSVCEKCQTRAMDEAMERSVDAIRRKMENYVEKLMGK